MKKIPTWLIVVVVVVLLIASKFIFFPKGKDKVSGRPKGGGPAEMAVSYHVADTSRFSNRLFAAGRVGALNQVDLVAEAAGKVSKINFREGETVSAGALLLKLNDADLQAQLNKTRTQLGLSEQKLKRLRRLLDVEGVSREEFEMQENELAALKADESFIQAQIAKTSIIAPFSGVVGLKNVSEGSYVSPATPVVSLVQMKPLYIEFSVPEKYHALFREGLNISFSTESAEDSKGYQARIYAIEPRVDEATKTIRARALYDGKTVFYPGSFVRVHVKLGEVNDAIMVPSQCVIPTISGQKVFVAKNGVATEVPVKIGLRTEAMVQVTEGIVPGDTIVASGMLGVKAGTKLKLVKAVN